MPNLRSIYKTDRFEDLPLERTCNKCGETKPRADMIIVFNQRGKYYYFSPKCKVCHNARERGHRREYKRAYLRRWRRANPDLNDSYWKGDPNVREAARLRAANRTDEHNQAIAIQRRCRTHGYIVPLAEARRLLKKFGRCFPTRYGLTRLGLLECEKIRNRLRHRSVDRRRRQNAFHIRLMVYEEGGSFVIPPAEQPVPYEKASANLKKYWQNKKLKTMEAAA